MSSILIADDDASTRATIADVLREEGHDVVTVSDGREAIDALERVDPALVVTDLHMPLVDGTELLGAVRKRNPGTPVVIITADGEAHARLQTGAVRADGYLLKPIDLDAMLAQVDALLDAR